MQPATIPAHVPSHLVLDYPFSFGAVSDKHPFEDLLPPLYSYPKLFYATHAYPGGTASWVARDTKLLRQIYLDTEHFSNMDFAQFGKMLGETWSLVPAETDPPLHALHRAFVNPIFTPNAIARLSERMRTYAREYCALFRDRGSCDLMSEFAFEFPIKVVLEMMGLPLEMTKQFLEWEVQLLHATSVPEMIGGARNVTDYLRAQILDREKNPRDDLISFGVKAEIDGRKLTPDELVGFTFNLFVGGLDTVSTNIGWHFRHLATHPDDQATLRADPSKIPAAIEEFMRAYAAVTTFRTCSKETEIEGVVIKPGDKVAMVTTLAGRDPNEYENPNEVQLGRKPRHVSFAFGPHLCVGMHLARLEMRTALEVFLAEIPEFRLAPDARIECHLGGMIQNITLPLVW